MPMGIMAAPCHFYYTMDQTLKGIKHTIFLDDATIGGVGKKPGSKQLQVLGSSLEGGCHWGLKKLKLL